MSERRYADDQVREIFSLATTGDAPDRLLPEDSGGLTLGEIQRIGTEAGIEPALVAQAAAKLDARGTQSPVQRSLGLPIGMSRVVPLSRAPTDQEWGQLVTQFRTTFGMPGQATTSGGLHEWTQGDVHIAIEPTEAGWQLRLTARNELGVVLNGLGIVTGGMSLLMSAVVASAGKPEKVLAVFAMFGGISLAAFATNLIRAPRWARSRQQQIATIAEHVLKRLS